MTVALDLLDLAHRHGIEMVPVGDRIRLRAQVRPPAEVLEQLRAHKTDVLAALNARIAGRWGDATEAVTWFLSSDPPGGSFVLWPGDPPHCAFVTVVHPERFWRALKGDIAAGPGRARDMYGAVRRDVVRLYELFGNPCATEPAA